MQPSSQSEYWQTVLRNRVLLVVLGMVVLVPLLAFPSNQTMQGLASKAIQVIAALLAALLIMRSRLSLRAADLKTFLGTGANAAILLFLLSAILSLAFGSSEPGIRRLGVQELQRLIAGSLLYFAIVYQVERSDQLSKITDSLVWVGGIMAVLGLASQASQEGVTRINLFGNSQLFGAFMLILFPMALITAMTEENAGRRLLSQVVSVLILCGLFLSGLRSAWIGGAGVLIAALGFSLIGRKRNPATRQARIQYVAPLLTILAACVYATLQGDALQMLTTRLERGAQTLSQRQVYWKAAQALYATRPVFGVGLGAFPVYQYEYTKTGRPKEAVLQTRPALSEMAHNLWWRILAEQGTVGILCFASILISFLATGGLALREMTGKRRFYLLGAMSGVVGFALDAFSNPGWEFAQISMFFWLVLGVGVACMRSYRQPGSRRSAHLSG